MPFGYLKDPLFLACFGAYWLHRLAASLGLSAPILRAHLNDVICIGFWVPMMLWAQRRLGLRRHDGRPRPEEIALPLLIWAALFEAILPASPLWSGLAVPDPLDVLSYALGAALAAGFWNWRYGRKGLAA